MLRSFVEALRSGRYGVLRQHGVSTRASEFEFFVTRRATNGYFSMALHRFDDSASECTDRLPKRFIRVSLAAARYANDPRGRIHDGH